MCGELLSVPRRRRETPVGLSSAVAPTIKSKSAAISASYPNLSTFSFPTKAAKAAGYFPNDRRLISARPSQSSCRIELYDDDASGYLTGFVRGEIGSS